MKSKEQKRSIERAKQLGENLAKLASQLPKMQPLGESCPVFPEDRALEKAIGGVAIMGFFLFLFERIFEQR